MEVTAEAIASLHWADFETLVEIMFSRSGWHRSSSLGGSQKLIDLALDQPTTGERAMVQVKSAADQRELDKYIAQCKEAGTFDRMFFICHSPKGTLQASGHANVHVWTGPALARTVVRLGLHDWVYERVA